MKIDELISVPIDGPPIILREGETLERAIVLVQQPVYGRVLFTSSLGVCVEGSHVTIRDCEFYSV